MIYLVKSFDKLKIGYTKNFAERLINYKSHNPDIEVVNYKIGTIEDEKVLHDYFKELIVVGEWYLYSEDIIDKFEQYCPLENNILIENTLLKEKLRELTSLREVHFLQRSVLELDKEEDILSLSGSDFLEGDLLDIKCKGKTLYTRIGNKYMVQKQ